MCGYGNFSEFYDTFMKDVDYKGRAEYLYGIFERFGAVPKLLLDMACGTGGFSLEFARKGIEVIGVDPSEAMLSVARQKTDVAGVDILYLCQCAEELELYGTVDGVVCCLDSVNHIIDYDSLRLAFERISLFLEPGKLFIFDANTCYKHRCVLGNETFSMESEGVFCVWQNYYDSASRITTISLDFFKENDDLDLYERYSEDFCERAYTVGEFKKLLRMSGMKLEAVYGDMTDKKPQLNSERNIYVARKVE